MYGQLTEYNKMLLLLLVLFLLFNSTNSTRSFHSWPLGTLYHVDSVSSTVDHCCMYTLSPLSYSPFCIWTIPSHRTIARLLLTINNHFFHSWCILTCDLIMKKKNLQRRKVLDIACNWRVAFVGLIKCYLYIWSLKIVFYHNIFKSSFIYFLLLIYFLWNNAQILKTIEFSVKSKHTCTHTSNKNSR